MDKSGFLKTLEAIIGIILLLIVIYTIIPRYVEPKPDVSLSVQDAQRFIVNDISENESLRTLILTSEDDALIASEVENAIKAHMIPNYDFVCAICPQTGSCIQLSPIDKRVYMSDVFIASSIGLTLATQNPKIVRFWMWTKPTKNLAFYNACRVVRV